MVLIVGEVVIVDEEVLCLQSFEVSWDSDVSDRDERGERKVNQGDIGCRQHREEHVKASTACEVNAQTTRVSPSTRACFVQRTYLADLKSRLRGS